ncbi:MAG: hypothetical protein JXR37_04195 [Kiritimatiellae bacterium]|nr:hypothetical protein [Kiritimatiellia bacterium]
MSNKRRYPRRAAVAVLAALLVWCGACSRQAPAPAGLSLEALAEQGRAPLEIVSFGQSGGIGDAILAQAVEQPEGLALQRHVLVVSNVSDRVITAFRSVYTYLDADGQPITPEGATLESRYGDPMSDGIAPGATAQLEVRLLMPREARATCAFAEIIYKAGSLGGIWKPAQPESEKPAE